MSDIPTSDPTGAAARLIDKLREFADQLDADERRALVALLAPGVDAAWTEEPEVSGFDSGWSPEQLPEHLAAAIRQRDLRIEGW